MADILLFHHALGQTPGFLAFAEELRQTGHTVRTPDLFEGRIFDTLDEGVTYARKVGLDTIIQRGRAAAAELPDALVYAGFSLGVMPAQMLAQTRPGAKGALLFHSCVPASEFGSSWPENVSLQIHAIDADKFFVEGGDLDAPDVSSRRLRTLSFIFVFIFIFIQEAGTCLPTRVCIPTTKTQQHCSSSAFYISRKHLVWEASSRVRIGALLSSRSIFLRHES